MEEHKNNFVHLPYRKGVGIMLLNDEGGVFVGKRIDTRSEAWQMPQGGIDDGEDCEVAAYRELEEETCIKNVELLYQSKEWHRYDFPEHLVPKLWNGGFRGQQQKWFLMRFKGQDTEININTAEPEFCAWKWSPTDELNDIIVPFKRALYQKIITEFKEHVLQA